MIFDMDGTLVDSSRDIADSLNHTLKALGFSVKSREEVQDLIGEGMKRLLEKATGSSEEALVQKAVGIFREHYLEHCADSTALYPGAREILEEYRAKKKAMISNKPYPMVLKILEHCGIKDSFDAVLGAESTAEKKPHPEPVLKSIALMGVPAGSSLIVGDGPTDIQAGKAAGILTCAVTYGFKDRKLLETCNPDFFIDRIEDLRKIVC